jgi:uncharacterized membrane protein YphA (DoxX/SURF4 family)
MRRTQRPGALDEHYKILLSDGSPMQPADNENYFLPARFRAWEEFWFRPADPSNLALIRILCGLIVLYTLFVYSFKLQELMGEHAWLDMQLRMEIVRDRPVQVAPLNWYEGGILRQPKAGFEMEYALAYRQKWGSWPLAPYPKSPQEAKYLDDFRDKWQMDLRLNGLTPSLKEKDKDYVERYMNKRGVPPPAYVESEEEEREVDEYIERQGYDPRRVHAIGMPIFSLWFHVLDPQAMAVVHVLFVVVAALFTLGFCTRITAATLWFGSLCYIHRNNAILFGVDTMMNILLLYLMIGPSGAVYSIDHMIRKWWVQAKPGFVLGWYRFWKLPAPAAVAPADPVSDVPEPSVSANVAIRLLQIHVCIIYLMAGLSKLLGNAWWNGTAIWMTVANYEFAPMNNELYMWCLRQLGSYQILYDGFNTGGGLFTLAFEIGYAFLIWRPRLRWVFLAGALTLHGGIGLLMGLKTFSLMMLVMNMAFLRKEEAAWMVQTFMRIFTDPVSLLRKPVPAAK